MEGSDHAVRYLCLYDNQFLRFFNGHTDKVVSIAMSPTDDHFITGSVDRHVSLFWLGCKRKGWGGKASFLRKPPGLGGRL